MPPPLPPKPVATAVDELSPPVPLRQAGTTGEPPLSFSPRKDVEVIFEKKKAKFEKTLVQTKGNLEQLKRLNEDGVYTKTIKDMQLVHKQVDIVADAIDELKATVIKSKGIQAGKQFDPTKYNKAIKKIIKNIEDPETKNFTRTEFDNIFDEIKSYKASVAVKQTEVAATEVLPAVHNADEIVSILDARKLELARSGEDARKLLKSNKAELKGYKNFHKKFNIKNGFYDNEIKVVRKNIASTEKTLGEVNIKSKALDQFHKSVNKSIKSGKQVDPDDYSKTVNKILSKIHNEDYKSSVRVELDSVLQKAKSTELVDQKSATLTPEVSWKPAGEIEIADGLPPKPLPERVPPGGAFSTQQVDEAVLSQEVKAVPPPIRANTLTEEAATEAVTARQADGNQNRMPLDEYEWEYKRSKREWMSTITV